MIAGLLRFRQMNNDDVVSRGGTATELKVDYWPRLTKDKRVMFVKTDFDKWRDEDERECAHVASIRRSIGRLTMRNHALIFYRGR